MSFFLTYRQVLKTTKKIPRTGLIIGSASFTAAKLRTNILASFDGFLGTLTDMNQKKREVFAWNLIPALFACMSFSFCLDLANAIAV